MTRDQKPDNPRRNPGARRDAILDAALIEFAEKGYLGANTGHIAITAKVAAGTVFKLFTTKDALARAVFERSVERYGKVFQSLFKTSQTPRQQFTSMWRTMVVAYQTYPHDFIMIELQQHATFMNDENREQRRVLRQPIQQWVEAMQKGQHLLPTSADILRALVVGTFIRLVREHRDGILELTTSLLEEAEETCWQAVKARPLA